MWRLTEGGVRSDWLCGRSRLCGGRGELTRDWNLAGTESGFSAPLPPHLFPADSAVGFEKFLNLTDDGAAERIFLKIKEECISPALATWNYPVKQTRLWRTSLPPAGSIRKRVRGAMLVRCDGTLDRKSARPAGIVMGIMTLPNIISSENITWFLNFMKHF